MSGSLGPMKLDFSSFYKFVASVGLVLVAASVVLPWFVLRASVPEAPAGTRAAQLFDVALDERANQYAFIVRNYPWVSLALFGVGGLITGYGLIAWHGRQKKQDADEDELYRQRRELGQTTRASEGDREQKLDREAQSEDGDTEGVISRVADGSEVTKPSAYRTGASLNSTADRFRARRAFIAEAENRVGDALRVAFDDSHTVEAGVRIGGPDSPIIDLVARANDPSRWSSFAMEIKLASTSSKMIMSLRESMLAVAIAARDVPEGKIQTQRVGRPPMAKSVSICLFIAADVETPASPGRLDMGEFAARMSRLVQVVNTVLSRQVGAILVPQSEIANLSSAWLRDAVLDVMRRPETPAVRESTLPSDAAVDIARRS